jgi:hypothetical protein
MKNNKDEIVLIALYSSLLIYSFINHDTLLHTGLSFLSKPGLFFIFGIVSILIGLILLKQRKATLALLSITSVMIIYLNLNSFGGFPRLELVTLHISFYQLSIFLLGIAIILILGYLFSLIFLPIPDLSVSERILLTLSLGLGINMVLLISVGIFMKLTIINVLVAQFTIILLAIFGLLKKGIKLSYPNLKAVLNIIMKSPKIHAVEMTLFIIIISYACFTLYPLLATPVTEWDSLTYGVNYSKVIFENSGIPLIAGPSIGKEMSFNFPPGNQILVAYFFMLANDADELYYRLLASVVIIALVLTVYELSATLKGSRYQSLLAIIIVLTVLNLFSHTINGSYIIYTTLFVTLSAIYIMKALNSGSINKRTKYFENTAALFGGFAGLTSYIGILTLGIILIYFILRKLSIQRVIFLLSIFFLVISPWYLRNLILLDNPLYPMFGLGKFLDPILYASTSQHFRNWFNLPFEDLFLILIKWGFWIPIYCILGIIILPKPELKQKQLLLLSLYISLISLAPFLFHAPFPRYLLISYPFFSALLARLIIVMLTSRDWKENITSIMILLILMSLFLPAITSIKPVYNFDNKMDYVISYYADAEAWKWINYNTEKSDVIATFEIREYYIDRKVMLLDGYNASPLYRIKDIGEALKYLHQLGVGYILSAPWASPQSPIMPPAYDRLIITKYFGSQLLPPVYVSPSGAAVYSVKPIKEEKVYELFKKENLIPPLKELKLNVIIFNSTQPPTGRIYIAIPCDYVKGQMHVWVNSSNKLVSVELWKGLIDWNTKEWWKKYEGKARGPSLSIGLSAKNPGFVWNIDSGGYYTLMVVSWEKDTSPFNVTLYIKFYNKWETEEMFLGLGSQKLNLNITNYHVPPMEMLYLNIKEPAILNVKSQSFDKRISLEIFKGLIPKNTVTDWWMWSTLVERRPALTEGFGTKDPAINQLFLPPGHYSLLVVCWDICDLGKSSILLEIELIPLS